MASYDTIKQSIKSAKQELESIENDNADKQSRLRKINTILSELDNKETEEIKEQKSKRLKELEEESVKDLEDGINQINTDIETLNNKVKEKEKELSPESFLAEYTDELDMLDQINKLSVEVQEVASKLLGEDMAEKILSNLDSYEIEINLNDLEDYLKKHKKTMKTLEYLKKDINFNFYEKIDKFLAMLNPCKDDATMDNTKIKNSILAYVVVCGVASLSTLYFASSWVFVACLCVGAINLKKSSIIKQMLLDSKVLSDNIDRVKEKLKEYANEDSAESLEKLNTEFQNLLSQLESKRTRYEEELEETLNEVRNNFEFNDDMIRQNFRLSRKSKEKEITDINKSIVANNNRIKEIRTKLVELNKELQIALKEIRSQYITFKGDNEFFDTNYVLDVTDTDVVSWEHPKDSCLFLYDGGVNYTSTFIRLFIAETMSKFKCCSCLIDVWDTVNLASSYRVFVKSNDDPSDKSRGCVSVMINEDEVEASLTDLESDLTKRIYTIKQETDNIDSFNELMQKVEGNCKEYRFLIMDKFDESLLSDNRLTRILATGGEVGIYPMIFYRTDDFLALKDNAVKLLRNIKRIYILEDECVSGCARNKLLQELTSNN